MTIRNLFDKESLLAESVTIDQAIEAAAIAYLTRKGALDCAPVLGLEVRDAVQ